MKVLLRWRPVNLEIAFRNNAISVSINQALTRVEKTSNMTVAIIEISSYTKFFKQELNSRQQNLKCGST